MYTGRHETKKDEKHMLIVLFWPLWVPVIIGLLYWIF